VLTDLLNGDGYSSHCSFI